MFVYFVGFAVDAGKESVCVCVCVRYGFSVNEVDDDAGIGHIQLPNVKMIMHVETPGTMCTEARPRTDTPRLYIGQRPRKKVRTWNSISYLGGGGVGGESEYK